MGGNEYYILKIKKSKEGEEKRFCEKIWKLVDKLLKSESNFEGNVNEKRIFFAFERRKMFEKI